MRHGGAGVARVVPARRRAHLGPARRQGGLLLRRRARAGRPAGAPAACRCTAPTCSPPSCPSCGRRCSTTSTRSPRSGRRSCGAWRWASASPAAGSTDHLTADPLMLFRIFRYPPQPEPDDGWGVAEHTDYGLLTILLQDDAGGLEVRTADGWVAAPPVPGSFVCNLGDMLERMTGGRYRSTPHRVRNTGGDRPPLVPVLLRPGLGHRGGPAPARRHGDRPARHPRAGTTPTSTAPPPGTTYGEYLTAKVGKVFPDLRRELDACTKVLAHGGAAEAGQVEAGLHVGQHRGDVVAAALRVAVGVEEEHRVGHVLRGRPRPPPRSRGPRARPALTARTTSLRT